MVGFIIKLIFDNDYMYVVILNQGDRKKWQPSLKNQLNFMIDMVSDSSEGS